MLKSLEIAFLHEWYLAQSTGMMPTDWKDTEFLSELRLLGVSPPVVQLLQGRHIDAIPSRRIVLIWMICMTEGIERCQWHLWHVMNANWALC